MRLPPRQEMRPASPALHAEKFHVPIKHIRNLDLLDGTREIPQEHCHKPTRRQMSPNECEIDQCSPNQLEMKPDSPVATSAVPCSTSYTKGGWTSFRQLQTFPETLIQSLEEHQFQHSNTRKAPCIKSHLEKRADSPALTEEV